MNTYPPLHEKQTGINKGKLNSSAVEYKTQSASVSGVARAQEKLLLVKPYLIMVFEVGL